MYFLPPPTGCGIDGNTVLYPRGTCAPPQPSPAEAEALPPGRSPEVAKASSCDTSKATSPISTKPPSCLSPRLLTFSAERCCCQTAPSPPKIPEQTSSRLPSNIPLRTLPSRQRPDPDSGSTSSFGPSGDAAHHHFRPSSESRASSEGDIAEQLADHEDPIRFRLGHEPHDALLGGTRKSQKRVRVELPPDHDDYSYSGVIDKEAIEVPTARPRRVPRAERFLASIMGSNPIHGLTGRPLMCVVPPVPSV